MDRYPPKGNIGFACELEEIAFFIAILAKISLGFFMSLFLVKSSFFLKLNCYSIENNCTRRRKCPLIVVHPIAQRKVAGKTMGAEFLTLCFLKRKHCTKSGFMPFGERKGSILILLCRLKSASGIAGQTT